MGVPPIPSALLTLAAWHSRVTSQKDVSENSVSAFIITINIILLFTWKADTIQRPLYYRYMQYADNFWHSESRYFHEISNENEYFWKYHIELMAQCYPLNKYNSDTYIFSVGLPRKRQGEDIPHYFWARELHASFPEKYNIWLIN